MSCFANCDMVLKVEEIGTLPTSNLLCTYFYISLTLIGVVVVVITTGNIPKIQSLAVYKSGFVPAM